MLVSSQFSAVDESLLQVGGVWRLGTLLEGPMRQAMTDDDDGDEATNGMKHFPRIYAVIIPL